MEKRKGAREGSFSPGHTQSDLSPSHFIQGAPSQDMHATNSGRGGTEPEDPANPQSVGDGGLGTQVRSDVGPRDRNPPVPEQATDDWDEGKLPGKDMIDRANSGKPVLSGPEDLGMKRDDGQQQKAQLREKPGQDKSSLPTPDSQIL